MVLVLDVGNTNIKVGVFIDGKLKHSWRMSTSIEQTSDEMGMVLLSFFDYLKLDRYDVEGVMISSVIPSANYTIEHMCRMYLKKTPIFVGPGIKTGINIFYDSPKELGSDRIVTAVAAYEMYGGPCITVDFGTATSFGAISGKGEFVGGVICPGIKISAEALTQNTSKLPKIDLVKPPQIKSKYYFMYAGRYIIRIRRSGRLHIAQNEGRAWRQGDRRRYRRNGRSHCGRNQNDRQNRYAAYAARSVYHLP